MNYYEAHELLERVKHGYRPPIDEINRALCLTGDLDFALCPTCDDKGLARLHPPSGERIEGFARNVGRITPLGEGAHRWT